jgi:hypothetical protein
MLKVLGGKAGSDPGDRTRMPLHQGHSTDEIRDVALAGRVLPSTNSTQSLKGNPHENHAHRNLDHQDHLR